jgi:hypothetical protein
MAVVNIAVGIAGIVVSVVQYAGTSKKQNYISNQGLAISSLSYADQRALNEKMLKANTQTERQAIMANGVATINAAYAAQSAKNSQATAYLIFGASVALILAVYLIKKA